MDSETEEIIKKQMEKLPIEVKRLFINSELSNKINDIGKKNELNEEQLGLLHTETNLVMLGLIHPDEYPNELKNKLNVSDLRAVSIINDINKDILNGIREKLIDVFDADNEFLTEERRKTEPDWKQNLNFIFPRWDYLDSDFME
jgi:hypothetical protein